MATVVDYSAGVPPASAIKNAGHEGAVRYISPPRALWMKGKPVQRAEVDDFDAHGLKMAMVWQYGKEQDSDVMRGWNGGLWDAYAAQDHLNAIRCAGHPVFFAVDFDISVEEWNSRAVEYFRAACSVLGRDRVGIYGHSRVCAWAAEDGVIAEIGDGKFLAWQTAAWSHGERAPEAVLYQRPGHVVVGGVECDVNEVLHPEWGWRALAGVDLTPVPSEPAPTPESTPVVTPIDKKHGWSGDPTWLADALRAFGVNVVETDGWQDWGNGDFGGVWGVVVHHTGGNNTPVSMIRNGHAALQGLLSQVHLGRDGTATMCGVGVAWHAGMGSWPGLPTNNANYHTIGIEAVSDGQSPWTQEQLDAYYRICAAICWVLDVPADHVIGHKEWGAIQGKWDPGLIDMGAFRANVQHYIDNPPFKEAFMAAFNQITDKYPSRVEGSDVVMTPLDALLNTDAHSFTTRVMVTQMSAEMKKQTEMLQRIENAVVKK